MMRHAWDVIVVGAGPGGSTAAARLAQAGVEVLLVDKERFPREKPCSDIYGPFGFRTYEELGVYDRLVEAGYLRFMPEDPILERAEWGLVYADAETDEDLQPYDDEFGSQTGIIDVYSKAPGPALDGSDYADW